MLSARFVGAGSVQKTGLTFADSLRGQAIFVAVYTPWRLCVALCAPESEGNRWRYTHLCAFSASCARMWYDDGVIVAEGTLADCTSWHCVTRGIRVSYSMWKKK